LKIIATDVISGRAIEFSSDNPDTSQVSVIEAVTASSCYPIFFRPMSIKKHLLLDGGLSCNMPTFLFNSKKHKKLPIYAFDIQLEVDSATSNENIELMPFLWKLGLSALDASNNIISETVGAINVPVVLPSTFGTFDFNLTGDMLDSLYDKGKRSALAFLSEDSFTQQIVNNNKNSKFATILYGNLNFLSSLIIADIERNTGVQNIKLWIYGDITSNNSKIISFAKKAISYRTIETHEYSLNEDSIDCVKSWNNIEITLSYYPKTNIVRLCYPICRKQTLDGSYGHSKIEENEILALLCIDFEIHFSQHPFLISEALSDSNLAIEDFDLDEKSATILKGYAYILRNAMLGQQVVFHESKGVNNK